MSFEQILAVSDRNKTPFDRIVLENSGVAEPNNIREAFAEAKEMGHPVASSASFIVRLHSSNADGQAALELNLKLGQSMAFKASTGILLSFFLPSSVYNRSQLFFWSHPMIAVRLFVTQTSLVCSLSTGHVFRSRSVVALFLSK
jgi:hypothetical protein